MRFHPPTHSRLPVLAVGMVLLSTSASAGVPRSPAGLPGSSASPARSADPVTPVPAPATPAGPSPPASDKDKDDEPGALGPLGNLFGGLAGGLPGPDRGTFPVGMAVTLDNSVGTGTFMLEPYARQPMVASLVRLEPSLNIWRSLSARMRLDVTKEWIASYSQTSTVPNQLMLGDLWMILTMPEIYREPFTGLGFGASMTTFAPTSIESRGQTLVVAVRPSVRVDWKKWGFDLSYSLALRKNFHQYANPTVDARAGDYECPDEGRCMLGNVEVGPVYRADEDIRRLPDGRVLDTSRRNVSHTVYHTVAAAYSLFDDQLTLSATLILLNSFRYQLPRSESFSSVNASNEWGHTDSTWGVLDVTYAPFQHLGFSAGVSSLQPFWSNHRGPGMPGWDNDGTKQGAGKLMPNFPFFDASTPANNFTTLYFDILITL